MQHAWEGEEVLVCWTGASLGYVLEQEDSRGVRKSVYLCGSFDPKSVTRRVAGRIPDIVKTVLMRIC